MIQSSKFNNSKYNIFNIIDEKCSKVILNISK